MKMRRKKKAIIIAALFGGVVLTLWLAYSLICLRLEKAIEREFARIRARGEPVTLEELAPPEIPDAENAAIVYEQAFVHYQASKDWKRIYQVEVKELAEWSEEDTKIMREYIEKNEDCLRLLYQAANYDKCRFALDYSAGSAMQFPHFNKTREFARLLARDALLKAKEGKIDHALESIRAGLHIGKALSSDPFLISQLTRNATDALALSVLEKVLNENGCERTAFHRLLEELDIQVRRQAFIKSMKGRVGPFVEDLDAYVKDPYKISEVQDTYRDMIDFFRPFGVAVDDVQGTEVPIGRLGFLARPLIRRDGLFCLRALQESAELSGLPFYRAKNRLNKLEKETKKAPFYCVLTKMVFFNITDTHLFQDRHEAKIGLAQLALGLKIFKAEKGKCPDALSELVPEILSELPQDPFTGKDFVYKREGEGFLVYSLGENGTDEGGKWDDANPYQHDIPWRCKR